MTDCIPVCVYDIAMHSVKEAAEKLGLDTGQVRRQRVEGSNFSRDSTVPLTGKSPVWLATVQPAQPLTTFFSSISRSTVVKFRSWSGNSAGLL